MIENAPAQKLRLAVWKFASCDGCQLSLLDCEDELLAVADRVEIANFPEASSAMQPGPYDISLVEGSITRAEDVERIHDVRRQSKFLITIGACATAGGIQALRNFKNINEFISLVYAKPEYIDTLSTSTAIEDHVKVDFELRGCPINKEQLLEVINAFVNGRKPNTPTYSVCQECKKAGHICVMVAQGTACLGPVTQAGCGAICPGYNRGCYGCFGPSEQPNTESLSKKLKELNMQDEQILRIYSTFNTAAPAFNREAESYRKLPVHNISQEENKKDIGEGKK